MLSGAVFLACLAASAYDDNWPVPKDAAELKNPVTVSSAVLKKAKGTFSDECAFCHGYKGDGKGDGADALAVHPADFTSALAMLATSDGELFYKISEGRTPMPSFRGKLSAEERWGLVHYIRTFVKKPSGKPSK